MKKVNKMHNTKIINQKKIRKDDIAIVGVSCRFPDAKDYNIFWDNIRHEVNSVNKITEERWNTGENCSVPDDGICDYNGMINDYDRFDNEFFNISPREASNMDPQQRLLLEETYKCIEDSGIAMDNLRERKTSVYAGVTGNDYNLITLVRGKDIDSYASLGSYECMIANRVSHAFGFRGISLTLDTACASSLVALHEAKENLIRGESDYAFAAGVCIAFHPWRYITFSKSRMMSPDGLCKTFDQDANGFVQGEGIGVLLLQRLEDAMTAGNHIYGIIKGSAVNHGGNSLTIAAPSVEAQKNVLLAAYENAKISPGTVSYIEAHGTGTSLGDPIEVEALTQAFQEHTTKKNFCKIGSVKTNIGHLGSAAGIAGIIKVLLMMKNREVPKLLNFNRLNPIIDLDNSAFAIPESLSEWKPNRKDTPLRAGVSSFGFGGVNAHVVLEDYGVCTQEQEESKEIKDIFVLSAKTCESLEEHIKTWKSYINTQAFHEQCIENICATLLVGRENHPVRCGTIVNNKEDIKTFVNMSIDMNETKQNTWCLRIGQLRENSQEDIEQLVKMEVFKRTLDEALHQLSMSTLHTIKDDFKKWCKKPYKHPLYVCIVEYVRLHSMIELGFKPSMIMCEKSGIWIGLLLSGMASLDDVVKMIKDDAEISGLTLSRPEIPFYDHVNHTVIQPYRLNQPYLENLFNGLFVETETINKYIHKARTLYHNQYTFKKNLEEWIPILKKYNYDLQNMLFDDLYINSNQDEHVVEKLVLMLAVMSAHIKLNKKWHLSEERNVKQLRLREILQLISDRVMDKEIAIEILIDKKPDYCKIIELINREQVIIDLTNGYDNLVEFNKTLQEIENHGKWLIKALDMEKVESTISQQAYLNAGDCTYKLKQGVQIYIEEASTMKEILLDLWLKGVDIKWQLMYSNNAYNKQPLPTYSFIGTRHWLPPEEKKESRGSLHPMVDVNESTLYEEKFMKTLHIDDFYVRDHIVDGKVILPGVAYLEMARAAGELALGKKVIRIKDVMWVNPIVMDRDEKDIYMALYPEDGYVTYEIYSLLCQEREIHSRGKLLYDGDCHLDTPRRMTIDAIREQCHYRIDKRKCYEEVFSKHIGFDYGPAFQVTQEAYGNEEQSLEILDLPRYLEDDYRDYVLHPSIIDAALRSITWIGGEEAYRDLVLHIPFALGELTIHRELTKRCYAYATIATETKGKGAGTKRFNVTILDEEGRECISIKDFTIRDLRGKQQKNRLKYYATKFIESPLKSEEDSIGRKPQKIVIFDDNIHRREVLKKDIEERFGIDTIIVTEGRTFRKHQDDFYEINPEDEMSYGTLFSSILEESIDLVHIIHMWNMDNNVLDSMATKMEDSEQLTKSFDKGLYSILYMVKAYMAIPGNRRLKCFYSYASNHPDASPQFDMVNAFAKSVTTNRRLELVSLHLDKHSQDAQEVSQILLSEMIANQKTSNTHIQYRDSGRYMRATYSCDEVDKPIIRLKQNGIYIITGGLGAIGMLTAQYLTKKYRATLILTGRTDIDEIKQDKIDKLIKEGSKVVYKKCDVTDIEDVQGLLTTTKRQFGKINGIIHGAGVTDEIPYTEADKQVYENILAAKVYGTLHLDRVFANENLDVFIMYSSIAAVVGDYGRGSYASANAFMDRYATYREMLKCEDKRKGHTLSINWPFWKEGGMALQGEEAKVYYEYSGMEALSSVDAFRAFEYVLGSHHNQMIVAYGNEQIMNQAIETYTMQEVIGIESASITGEEDKHNNLLQLAEDYLKNILSKTTNMTIDKMNARENLERYGIDSIMIMELNKLMEKDFESLPRTLFFEYMNIHDLAEYLVASHYQSLNKLLTIPDSINHIEDKIDVSQLDSKKLQDVQYGNRYVICDNHNDEDDDIAIIGISGRYPMANNLDEFWNNLSSGIDCITEVPTDRWDHSQYFHPEKGKKGKVYCKWGGFMDHIDTFDPLFFHISPIEAKMIDPQERIFLETVYEAMEDSGYVKDSLGTNSVGVFVGIMNSHYQMLGAEELMKGHMMDVRSSFASIANRVSYFFNFNGPSIGIDTMCSSSLTAIHLACQSIHSGESKLAIAGGVNVIIHPAKYVFLSEQRFGSSEGRCRAFGEGGDGYVPAEGVGAVILKPFKEAIADQDHIYGVIKASTINHGGKTNGYTVPNPTAQSNLIVDAIEKAGINPDSISYLEAHGTGTKLGDPIEIAGLSRAISKYTSRTQFCPIGSVKANIGHGESAAGIASLTKVLLQMKHKQIVPSILAEVPNDNITFESSPFYIERSLVEWKNPSIEMDGESIIYPRRAGISSFGAGGTNVHLIVEEFAQETEEPQIDSNQEYLMLLSAKSQDRLMAYAKKIVNYLKHNINTNDTRLNASSIKRLEQDIRKAVVQVMNIQEDDIEVSESLFEYGIDPLELMHLKDSIKDIVGFEIDIDTLVEQESIQSIAQALANQYADQFTIRYEIDNREKQEKCNISLKNMAYTLQVGREAMECRMCIITSSIEELLRQLEDYCEGTSEYTVGLYETNNAHSQSVPQPDKNKVKYYEDNLQSHLDEIAELWVSGIDFNWHNLYGDNPGTKIQLPTYPFHRQRYWVPSNTQVVALEREHPFIDEIIPELSIGNGLTYTKKLQSTIPVLDHHRIRGLAVFPGVAHIEMAYAAMQKLKQQVKTITGITWLRPLIVDGEKDIEVVLEKNNSDIQYCIRGYEEGRYTTYSTGCFVEKNMKQTEDKIELSAIKDRAREYMNKDMIYTAFCQMGIDYGLYFQGIQGIWVDRGEALASIHMPLAYENSLQTYALHPTIMDAALQTISGIQGYLSTGNHNTLMPYSIDSIEVICDLGMHCYAYVKETLEHTYDIVLTDEKGNIAIKMIGVAVRQSMDSYEDFFYSPVWKKIDMNQQKIMPKGKKVLFVHSHNADVILEPLINLHSQDEIHRININQSDAFEGILDEIDKPDIVYFMGGITTEDMACNDLQELEISQKTGILSLYRMIKSFINRKWGNKSLTIRIITNDIYHITMEELRNPYSASIQGFAKSLLKEQDKWHVSCMDISLKDSDSKKDMASLARLIYEDNTSYEEIAIREDEKYIRVLHPTRLQNESSSAFRHEGVYMIIGGAGGIGLALSKYLAHTYNAKMILIGRSELNNDIRNDIIAIQEKGGQITYIRGDVTDEMSLIKAVDQAKSKYGRINGVIHSAIVLRDKLIINMEESDLTRVMNPKVQGSVMLSKVLDKEPLDFMMFFSSAQSYASNLGQSNYAASCTFQDAYALYLNDIKNYPVYVVNWGFWGSIGIVANDKYNKLMEKKGIYSIRVQEGIKAIEKIITNPIKQIMGIKASEQQLALMGIDNQKQIEVYKKNRDQQLDIPYKNLQLTLEDSVEEKHREAVGRIKKLGETLLVAFLIEAGVMKQEVTQYTKDELRAILQVIPKYNRLLDALLHILQDTSWIGYDIDEEIITVKGIDEKEAKHIINNLQVMKDCLMTTYPELSANINLIWLCIKQYKNILSGHTLARDIIFPNASMELVQNIYQGNKLADYFNNLVAHSLGTYIEARLPHLPSNDKIRIVEVGAGTGGTSSKVFEVIKKYGHRLEYYYTDITEMFIKQGEKTYGKDNPYVTFSLLNIEKPIQPQGYQEGRYDVVIATNVLHATRHIHKSLNVVNTMLKAGGQLILNEATSFSEFLTLTFGLLDGWWLYEDPHRRIKDSPLLNTSKWRAVLKQSGFNMIGRLGKTVAGVTVPTQDVIIAESNGVILRPLNIPSIQKVDDKQEEIQTVVKDKAVAYDILDKEDITDYIHDQIVKSLKRSLGISNQDIVTDRPFSEYGIDSITGIELVKHINDSLGVNLRTTVIFDYPNVTRLVNYIEDSHSKSIKSQLQEINYQHNQDEQEIASTNTMLTILEKLAQGMLNVDQVYKIMEENNGQL